MEGEKKRFRLYIDESGDHTFTLADDDNHRYLGLLGVWFDAARLLSQTGHSPA
jgi:hypothetical protein